MKFDSDWLDELSARARSTERLRISYDMRTSEADGSQRMFNALEPGTVLPIHRHQKTAETVVIVRGRLRETFYDEYGTATETFVLSHEGGRVALQVPPGVWHNAESLEPGTVIFEAKDGAYEPLSECDLLKR